MSAQADLQLALRDDLQIEERADGQFALRGPRLALPLGRPSPGWGVLYRRLAGGGVSEAELGQGILASDGVAGLAALSGLIRRLCEGGLLRQTLVAEGRPIATLIPGGQRRGPPAALAPAQAYRLSRFATMRAEQGQLLLETPLSPDQILIHDPAAAALLSALARPLRPDEIGEGSTPLAPAAALALLRLLQAAGALVAVDEAGESVEEQHPALAQWEHHDLLFHSRSRMGRHRNPYGGTYPGKARFAPLPALAPAEAGAEELPLPRPNMAWLGDADPPLSQVMERRRSVRRHAAEPISLDELGAFLYRAAAVRQLFAAEDGTTLSRRPYPAGGSIYELEVYPVVRRCAGLEPGLYRYEPRGHSLIRRAGPTPAVEQLLADMAMTAIMDGPPQLGLAITARFQRVQWKYRSVAYALVLKHVGVLYQTMYLVATAMGLAPCGLGGGNSDLFAAAAGLDYYAETTVGEFLLGRPG